MHNLGRRLGCGNKTTIAVAALLAGGAEALTRKAVKLVPVGGGVISLGAAATIAAELARPDLDLIKQEEQGVRDRRGAVRKWTAGVRKGDGRRRIPSHPLYGMISTFVGALPLHRTGEPS